MKLYPIVVKIEDQICSFIGGGLQIQKKIQDLLPYNVKIFIFSQELHDNLEILIQKQKNIVWKKSIQYDILLKSHLIFISDESIQKNGKIIHPIGISEIQSVLKFTKKYSKLLCFLDQPKYCNFYNTHIYEKGPILISISTSGSAPVIGNFIKQKLDNIITDDLILLMEFLSKYRSKIVHQIKDYQKRKQFYEKLLYSNFVQILKKNEEEALGKLFQYIVEFS